MKKLKIAQIVNIWQSVPPIGYGGTEYVVFDLTEQLVKNGHDVTMFTVADSKTSAKKEYYFKERLLHHKINWNNYIYPLTHFVWAYDQVKKDGKFDIIHGHYSLASDLISMSFAHTLNIPNVFTLHSPLPILEKNKDRKMLLNYLKNINYVSISNYQRLMSLNFVTTVYHGIKAHESPFTDNPHSEAIVWIGRIVPEKGLEDTIEVAKKLEKKLLIGGRIDEESENNLRYYKTQIESKLDNRNIVHFGEVTTKKRDEIFIAGKCSLFPIHWEEPFGLVMIESMACGTPVVAYARGSVPEIIKDGETGFIVNSSEEDRRGNWIVKKTGIEGLCEAVDRIYSLPEERYKQMRRNCRSYVEKNFTIEKMVDSYERVYQQIIENNKK